MTELLSDFISLERRYSRSINLDRDLDLIDSVLGYVPTTRSVDLLERFFKAYANPNSVRAWTLTGLYGTGKSSFAHFLAALCSPEGKLRQSALNIASQVNLTSVVFDILNKLSKRGLIRAVVTAQREPISKTIIKALYRGAKTYWGKAPGAKPKVLKKIENIMLQVTNGEKVNDYTILNIIQDLAGTSNSGLLLIIDEMGKNLEHTAQCQEIEDLYLLQQIAELPSGEKDAKVFILGLLHQSFADYASSLTVIQRNEWGKVQGRFEDIPFIESPEQTIRLIGKAIIINKSTTFIPSIEEYSLNWAKAFDNIEGFSSITADMLYSVYPIHPISVLSLPIISGRFAQNDRTIFTFLASSEPHSFSSFIKETSIRHMALPTLKPHHLYDYFVESIGMSMQVRPELQRWVEVQNCIFEARNLDNDSLLVLKTIGLLNLVASYGSLKATRELVLLALCNDSNNQDEKLLWNEIINLLLERGLITERIKTQELRIWEGSDFDIELEISKQLQAIRSPLSVLLNQYYPIGPLVAQRHSYQTGTLRYFNRVYCDEIQDIENLINKKDYSDGLICYWVNDVSSLSTVPEKTKDGKPLIVVCPKDLKTLKLVVYEYVALNVIYSTVPQLQTDGVARREIKHRIILAKTALEDALTRVFNTYTDGMICFMLGSKEVHESSTSFKARLSEICDDVFSMGPKLWNEIINRNELTPQASKARRELIEAMINNSNTHRLGLDGYGPECSIYESLFRETGIHRENDGTYIFTNPYENSGISTVWEAVENFCLSADRKQETIDKLYDLLTNPPYGIKKGIIPLVLLAVLLKHVDDICLYNDGTFIPILGPEHFEILVKSPEKFSIKYFEMSGIRIQLFNELYEVISKPKKTRNYHARNETLLGLVKPLIKFVSSLPSYTLNTISLSKEAIAVRQELLKASEPDELLFKALPIACGFNDLDMDDQETSVKAYRKKLVLILQELQSAYELLIEQCKDLLHKAFSVRSSKKNLREDIRIRANYLIGQCIEPRLKRFLIAAVDEDVNDNNWFESLFMIIADKPVESWNDVDQINFELKLSDLSRRFINLEVLQREFVQNPGKGFDVRRVTVTNYNGNEINRLVWFNQETRNLIEKYIKIFFMNDEIANNKQLQQAIITTLIEKVFETEIIQEKPIPQNIKENKHG